MGAPAGLANCTWAGCPGAPGAIPGWPGAAPIEPPVADAAAAQASLEAGLGRSRAGFVARLQGLLRGGVDEAAWEAVEETLIGGDVGAGLALQVVERARRSHDPGGPEAAVRAELAALLLPRPAGEWRARRPDPAQPAVILVVGVNGTGKTTTVGKLANLFKEAGQRPLICAADTFRAAAVEQLEIWARRAGVEMIRAREGADPAAVVFDAIASGKARGRDPILVDTAGRLHTRANLMQELDKIKRVAAREVAGAPHDVLLVLDATVGQNGLAQAREFMGVAGVNGIVLTKLDGTAKGGVAVAIAHDLKLPIRYVGVGEGIDDLVPFSAEEYVNGLFEQRW